MVTTRSQDRISVDVDEPTGPAAPESVQDNDAERLLAAAAVAVGPRRRRRRNHSSSLALAADLLVVAVVALVLDTSLWPTLGLTAFLVLSRTAVGLYRPRLGLSAIDELPLSLRSTTLALGMTSLALVIRDDTGVLETWILFFTCFGVGTVVLRTLLYAAVRRWRRRSIAVRRRTLVLGAGAVGGELVEAMRDHPEYGLEPVGFVDSDAPAFAGSRAAPLLLQDESRLGEALDHHRVDTLVVAYGAVPEAKIVDSVIEAVRHGCDILVVPRLFELQHDGPDVDSLRGLPLVRLRTDVTSSPLWLLKVAFDRTVAALMLLLLSPVMIAVAVAVLLESGRPILVHQERVGIDHRPITLLKFRSLRPADEHESQTNWNIAADPRMGKVGRIIRKTSLDELPQLFNILRGDMSLVGPRPERPVFVEQFSRDHDRYWARHRVPVGLTGWSQVNGLRGDTSIHQRARYDNYYIANWSLWLDIKIMLLTMREVLRGSGG